MKLWCVFYVSLLQNILQFTGLCPSQCGPHVAEVDGVVHHPLACLHHLEDGLPDGESQGKERKY